MYLDRKTSRRVKATIAARGLTQERVADRLGCSRLTLWRSLRGCRRVWARERREIARIVGLPVSSLFPRGRARGG